MAAASPTFISYAREDSEFAVTLARDLRKAGANIWLDQFDIPVGQNWPRAVQQALDSCGSFLVILSPASVESENVSAELDFALDEGKRIFPVLHRPCKRPFRIRAVQYADFTKGYQSGVAELIKALGVQPQEADSAARIEARASDAAHAAAIAKGRENSATLFRDGDLTGAIALLDKLIKDYPENASLRADRDAVASELARRQQAEARVQEKSERQLNPHSFPVAEPAGMDRQVATGTVRVSSAPHETRKPPVSAPAAPKVKS